MKKSDFNFELPEELIAQTPIENRAESRLLVADRQTGDLAHRRFKDIIEYIEAGDTLILNNTKVIPARIYGKRVGTGANVEFLLLEDLGENRWETLVKPGKKAKVGDTIEFGEGLLRAKVIDICDDGSRIVEFQYQGIFNQILESLGEMPLPPYIKEKLEDRDRYQTVYAEKSGSAAAPTAGLHFTEELLASLKDKGVNIGYVTLHVGLGTFRPVKEESIFDHKMHSEYYEIDHEVAELVNKTKKNNKRVIAVGTTSVRTLESAADDSGHIQAKSDNTEIFIYPGYKFKVVDNIITNFHLPESTLIMLVSAMLGREKTLDAYREAIEEKYRFFSFGDAMYIK